MENKRKIDEYIPKAIKSLGTPNRELVKDGKMNKTFAGQIATFAVAVSTSSLLSAVAFFSDNGSSSVERSRLMDVIYEIIVDGEITDNNKNCETKEKGNNKKEGRLLKYVKEKYEEYKKERNRLSYNRLKEDILNAAIAIKLAMNFYELVDNSAKEK